MPGQTNNQTILAAENQEIVALNEIRTAIANLSTPTVTVDLSGLETAITTLGVTLSSALETLNMQITQTNNCGCCGGSGTSAPTTINIYPPDPGSGQPGAGGPGDPPGDGQTEPTGTAQQIASRRCKVAILMVDNYLGGVAEWGDINNLDVYVNTVVAAGGEYVAQTIGSLAGVAIAAVMSQVLTPGPTPDDLFALALGGAIGGIIGHLVATNGTINFSEMSQFVQANRDKLVCSMFNSTNAFSAHANLMAAIDSISPGLDPGNRAFVDKMFPSVLMGLLFFVDDRYQVLEGALSKITDPCPCADDDPLTSTPTDDYKCKAANYIFDSFTDTVSNWSQISTMSWYSVASFITALGNGLLTNMFAGIFGLSLTSLATVVIPLVISYLGRLYWKGVGYFSPFELIAQEFEASKEAIICELYEAADVAAARAALEVHITDYVGTVMTAHPEWEDEQDTYINVVTSLLPNAVLNELFKTGADERAEISGYNPPDFAECAGCGFSDYIVWRNADGYNAQSQITEVQAGIYDIEAYAIGGGYGVVVEYTLGTQYNFLIALQSGTLSVHPSPGLRPIFKFVMSNYPANPLNRYSGDNFPNPAVQCFNFLEMYSANPFTIRLEQSNQCT